VTYFIESIVEFAALVWLESLGYMVKRGLEAWNLALQRLLVDGVTVGYRTLDALRDMWLPRLISGELRVKDAERTIKEIV
jgi:hypothetical protein